MEAGENSTEELKRQHQALKTASVKSRMESIDSTLPSDLLRSCVCGEKYTVCHALSCKKGGFVAQRHDGVRNLLTSLICKVCNNVEVEPQLQPLDNERFNIRSAVTSPEARLDFKAGGFWSRRGKTTSTIFKEQEEEKSGSTNRGFCFKCPDTMQHTVRDVETGSFTPLVFGTNGGMGADCNCFLKRLAEKLSEKNEEPNHITIT
ncbi:unnamed protein product, partial [Porites evermanni]